MHHIDTEIIARINVCTMSDQHFDHLDVAPKWSEMQSDEPIFLSAMVYPLLDLFLRNSFLSLFEKFQSKLLLIIHACLMQESVPSLIDEFNKGYARSLFQEAE